MTKMTKQQILNYLPEINFKHFSNLSNLGKKTLFIVVQNSNLAAIREIKLLKIQTA